MENDQTHDFELKIVAETDIEAIKTIERLLPSYKFKELKIINGYEFSKCNVYTIKIHGMATKTNDKE